MAKESKELQEKILKNEFQFFESEWDCTSYRREIFNELEGVDSKLVDDSSSCSKLVGLFQVMHVSLGKLQKAKEIREECEQAIQPLNPLAQRVLTLFEAISRLCCLNTSYVYGKSWLLDILSQSIVSSNKSTNPKRRLSFIRDHLTFSVFLRASFAISSEHRLVLAFFIACHMLMEEGSLTWREMELFAHFWNTIQDQVKLEHGLQGKKLKSFLQFYEETIEQVKG